MQIIFNGKPHECTAGISIATLLEQAGYAGRRVAVEINCDIVPRSQHETHCLREGDQVELVQAIGGG